MKISNIKCSLVFNTPIKWKNEIKEKCLNNKVDFFECGNILSVKYKFKLCIIQKKINSNTSDRVFLHVNITGIKNFKSLKIDLGNVQKTLIPKTWELKEFKIDNICSSFSFPYKIFLKKLSSDYTDSRYNIERFPAVFLKTQFGTAAVFESGKINIIGCKSVLEIITVWSHIFPYLKEAACMSRPMK